MAVWREVRRLFLRLLVTGWFAALTLVSRVEAQSTAAAESEPAGYRATVDEALREFAERNFEESRSLFARAHALYPNARTQRGLGFAEFELRNYGECIAQLEAALRSSVKPLEGELRSDTEQLLARARNFVARIFVELTPASGRLAVDGIIVPPGNGNQLVLQVGEHTLEAQALGFQSEKRHLRVVGGVDQTLTIVLLKDEVQQEAQAAPQAQRRWYKSPWLWGTLGVLALGAAGTALALTQGGSTTHEKPNGGSADAVLMGPAR